MQGTKLNSQVLPPPPGIIGSLRAGFDVIASHITAILMPVALDLLLWLGPRFSINQLAQPMLRDVGSLAATSGMQTDQVSAAVDIYRQFFTEFNLLVILRTFPIGISSLMSGRMPNGSPLGNPLVLQLDTPSHLFGLLFALILLGWVLGGLYFFWVAGLVIPKGSDDTVLSVGHSLAQTLLYSVICAVLVWSIGLPVLLVLYLLFAINNLLGQAVLWFLVLISLWLVVPIFFSPHGIFVRKQNAFASFLSGFHMTRLTLPTSSLFVLAVMLIGPGLNLLWSIPTDDSWLVLVGILGHAFITTALLAASFIYFQDMSAWLQTILARLRAGTPQQA